MKLYILWLVCIACNTPIEKERVIDTHFSGRLSQAVSNQVKDKVVYNGSYYKIGYPNGDVPKGIGVCTDVVIRAYRAVGVDLQKEVHEDMVKAKSEYDKRRHTDKLDPSIDHRRCPNLITYFTRQGAKLSITNKDTDYKPGDIVFWDYGGGHVGMVSNVKVPGTKRFYMVHNHGWGNQMQDFLFKHKIVAHFRWVPSDTK